ncbi:hypothetical protein CR205_03650 [Alteribacter lacisalsi]|uniref:Uncharacterized protein n=1 Tax=Alteribacter lacisalsi TaxID=2045244 RepID=A0A2W0HCH6_9BACI|nr:hypothetical protein [Alteribacter lacisalsi]PYZ97700.1 hypothetical protein CR205_03650 [Alteribacter lacisalsi]
MMSIVQLAMRTLPFFVFRIAVYAVFGLVSLTFLGLMIGLGILLFRWFEFASGFFLLMMAGTFFGVLGILRFIERYFLYMVKVGHIAVVTELLRTGKVPEGKNQIEFGKDQVKNHFGSANVAFVLDKIVYGAVRQIQRWLMQIGNFFNFVPGAQKVIRIVSKIMEVSLRYIDEAVLSYVMLRKSDMDDQQTDPLERDSVWKSAFDGVVLYAQSWKKIGMTAAGIVAGVYVLNILVFLIAVFPLMAIGTAVASSAGAGAVIGYFAIIGAYIFTSMFKRAFVDPLAMIAMVRTYQISVSEMEPSIDLQQKLLGVSSKFKELFNKSKGAPVQPVTDAPVSKGVTPST